MGRPHAGKPLYTVTVSAAITAASIQSATAFVVMPDNSCQLGQIRDGNHIDVGFASVFAFDNQHAILHASEW